MNKNGLDIRWLFAALNRAIRTIAQTALSMMAVGTAMSDINWVQIGSISLVAGIMSLLTSIATGLPEADTDGTISILQTDGENSVILGVKMDQEMSEEYAHELANKDIVSLRVIK